MVLCRVEEAKGDMRPVLERLLNEWFPPKPVSRKHISSSAHKAALAISQIYAVRPIPHERGERSAQVALASDGTFSGRQDFNWLRMMQDRHRAELKERLKEQGNACAICHESFLRLNPPQLDHDHVRRVLRAYLCQRCNRKVAVFERQGRATDGRVSEYVYAWSNPKPLERLEDKSHGPSGFASHRRRE